MKRSIFILVFLLFFSFVNAQGFSGKPFQAAVFNEFFSLIDQVVTLITSVLDDSVTQPTSSGVLPQPCVEWGSEANCPYYGMQCYDTFESGSGQACSSVDESGIFVKTCESTLDCQCCLLADGTGTSSSCAQNALEHGHSSVGDASDWVECNPNNSTETFVCSFSVGQAVYDFSDEVNEGVCVPGEDFCSVEEGPLACPGIGFDCCPVEGSNLCLNVLNDPSNCGSCGNSCDVDVLGEACVNGKCTTCGNGSCEQELGETCGNCVDCACASGSCQETSPGSGNYRCA